MRFFIYKSGKIFFCSGEHDVISRRIFKQTLKQSLKEMVRLRVHREAMVFETLQKEITGDQKRAISRLYREYRCFTCNGMINGETIEQSSNVNRVKFQGM